MTKNRTNQEVRPDIKVYYDGACPSCVRDRYLYEKICGVNEHELEWCDITGKEGELEQLGIDPDLAMRELHVRNAQGRILSEMDAYILLMERSIWLKPLAWVVAFPLFRPLLARLYHWSVRRRLTRTGRI